MKKSYHEGTWFDVPLGDGQRAHAVLLRDRHHVLDIAVYAPDGSYAWSGTVSDRGLLLQRWRHVHHHAPPPAAPEVVTTHRFLRTAHAERTIARACGVAVPDDAPLRAYDFGRVRHQTQHETFDVLQWRDALDVGPLREVEAWCARGGSAIRLYGDAVDDLETIAGFGVRSLALGDAPQELHAMPSVEHLCLEVEIDLHRVAAAFPNLRSLRVAARDKTIDVAPLASCLQLAKLDCSHVSVAGYDAMRDLKNLRALRLCRIENFRDVAPLDGLALETLALEDQAALPTLAPLGAMTALEQVELRGLWQFNVDEMLWLYDLPKLRRVTVDIGGRRKNAELYRRANWACAWPF